MQVAVCCAGMSTLLKGLSLTTALSPYLWRVAVCCCAYLPDTPASRSILVLFRIEHSVPGRRDLAIR
jgi:hypothetical protein